MTQEEIEYTKRCIQEDVHRFYIWRKWIRVRNQVLEIDKFECQDCRKNGIYKKATTVHHCQFLRLHPETALDIEYIFNGKRQRNLISLCHECHEARHGYRKRKEEEPLTEERWD